MASKPAASRSTTSTTSNVRRNLFHHQLTKRPTSASTSTSGTTLQDSIHDDSSDIIVRDRHGNYDVQVPTLQPEVDEAQVEEEEAASEKEKLDALVLERRNVGSLQPREQAELLNAVKASLRRTVASLDEDNWMFEAEQEKPGG